MPAVVRLSLALVSVKLLDTRVGERMQIFLFKLKLNKFQDCYFVFPERHKLMVLQIVFTEISV